MAEEKKSLCPLCGKEGYEEQPLDDAIKEEYLVSMLADQPFSRTYSMMGGKLLFTVRSMSVKLNQRYGEFLNLFRLVMDKFPDAQALGIGLSSNIEAALQIMKVVIKVGGKDHAVKIDGLAALDDIMAYDWEGCRDLQDVSDMITKAIARTSEGLVPGYSIPGALWLSAVGRHNVIVRRLLQACLDENFLGGTGQ